MGEVKSLANGPLAQIFEGLQRSNPKGNLIQLITRKGVGADKDLGIAGTVTETLETICPEPWIVAIAVQAVKKAGGAFRYGDYRMNVAKDALEASVALDSTTEFKVNGGRYKIISVLPGPSFWEFVIRSKKAEDVTP